MTNGGVERGGGGSVMVSQTAVLYQFLYQSMRILANLGG